ncbi:four-helix bundle copper-binding protein [Bdellovibrio sp.]|uniref:four-helix bundle copper-binding protein n=1 Tax=Bdellovibrio sp. TaxID=28201 RepID=UPI0039E6DDAE
MPINQIQDSDITKAINNCLNCARSCTETFHYCLEQKGTAFSGKHLSLLQICVESCQLSARLLIAGSEFHHQACELSFEICEACATECERYEEDEVFKRCAATCRRCAEYCRAMSGMTVKLPLTEKGQSIRM